MRRICTVVMFGLMAATTLSAQEARTDEQSKLHRIERVIIRGNRRIPASTIKSWIAVRKGDSCSPERLDRAVKDLFDTEHFEDVKVYVEDGLHGGRIVTVEVREKPLIEEIAYEGIDQATKEEVSEEWSKQKIDLSQGAEFDPVKVRRAAAAIKEVMVKRGNHQAKVNPMVEQHTPTTVSIVFKVEE